MIFDNRPCDPDGTIVKLSDGFGGGVNVVVETGVVAHSDNVSVPPPTGGVLVGPGVTNVSVSGGLTTVVVVSTVVSTTGTVGVGPVVTFTSSDGPGTLGFSVGPSEGLVGLAFGARLDS